MSEEERLDIYDEDGQYVGTAPRSVAHAEGYWHRTFHCVVLQRDAGVDYVLFQKRHTRKDTNPGKFDTTSAGHLLAGETLEDGIREPQEELGIAVTMDELIPLGVVRHTYLEPGIIDREMSHVFLLINTLPLVAYRPQLDEVSGLVRIRLEDTLALFRGRVDYARATGLEWAEDSGHCREVEYSLRTDDFVDHGGEYIRMLERIVPHAQAQADKEQGDRPS